MPGQTGVPVKLVLCRLPTRSRTAKLSQWLASGVTVAKNWAQVMAREANSRDTAVWTSCSKYSGHGSPAAF